VVDWIADCISLTALGVSGATYWAGRPRLKVSASQPGMLVNMVGDDGLPKFGIIVTLINDGGKEARINAVHLIADGVVGKPISAPQLPLVLEAGGDQQTWIFDYRDLQQQLTNQVATQLRDPNEPLLLRATVRTGSRTKQSGTIRINPPGSTTPRQLRRRELWQRRYQTWVRPSAFIISLSPTAAELDLRTHRVMIDNTGRGVLPASELILTVLHADGRRELVQGYQPISVPRIVGRRCRIVEVSLIDDSQANAGDTYNWVLRLRGFVSWGQPAVAFPVSRVGELRARLGGSGQPLG
jgi:hypothetical protein